MQARWDSERTHLNIAPRPSNIGAVLAIRSDANHWVHTCPLSEIRKSIEEELVWGVGSGPIYPAVLLCFRVSLKVHECGLVQVHAFILTYQSRLKVGLGPAELHRKVLMLLQTM